MDAAAAEPPKWTWRNAIAIAAAATTAEGLQIIKLKSYRESWSSFNSLQMICRCQCLYFVTNALSCFLLASSNLRQIDRGDLSGLSLPAEKVTWVSEANE